MAASPAVAVPERTGFVEYGNHAARAVQAEAQRPAPVTTINAFIMWIAKAIPSRGMPSVKGQRPFARWREGF